jgi:pimeloyl-ACP methyl ester carboxylesterase
MGTVIALDLLSTHPEYFSKAVLIATGDGLIGLPLYLKIFYLVLQICFHMRLFPVTCQVIFLYIGIFQTNWIRKESMIAFSLANTDLLLLKSC